MNGRHLLAALLLLFLLSASACARASQQGQSEEIQIDLSAVPTPAVLGEARLVIRIRDGSGRPINDAALAVKGGMTHAGMAPVLAESEGPGEDGYYNLPFEWTMSGDWVVTVVVTLADGTTAQQRFDLAVLAADEAVCPVDDSG